MKSAKIYCHCRFYMLVNDNGLYTAGMVKTWSEKIV